MLLTSGQISVALSSGVVGVFTTLLFLSGYVLQQQTVHSLQDAIRPRPTPVGIPALNPTLAKHFGRPPGHSFYDKYLASNRPKGGWAKVAYVQLLRSHAHVCSAVMMFAVLEGQESMAQRVILYPGEWDDADAKDAATSRSKRLLREAASQYKVMLQPMKPIAPPQSLDDDDDDDDDDSSSEQLPPTLSDEERYPLLQLLTLFSFNRIIYFQPSGLILDSSPLDLLFTLPMDSATTGPVLGLTSPIAPSAQVDRPAILLFQPSRSAYATISAGLPEGAYSDPDFLSTIHKTPAVSSGPSTPITHRDAPMILAETSALHNVEPTFNATTFLEGTGYVHFQDDDLPGPECYATEKEMQRAAPARKEARRAWKDVYDRFREGRLEVCGLDLEAAATHVDVEPVIQNENEGEKEEEEDDDGVIEMKMEKQEDELAEVIAEQEAMSIDHDAGVQADL